MPSKPAPFDPAVASARMTASLYAQYRQLAKRKGLGQWPVHVMTDREVANRKAKERQLKEERLAARRLEWEASMRAAEGTMRGRMRERRIELGMTAEVAARRIGCSEPAVVQWEHGRNHPREKWYPLIAEAYGVTVEWLVEGTA